MPVTHSGAVGATGPRGPPSLMTYERASLSGVWCRGCASVASGAEGVPRAARVCIRVETFMFRCSIDGSTLHNPTHARDERSDGPNAVGVGDSGGGRSIA
jgi:hypothetical protein